MKYIFISIIIIGAGYLGWNVIQTKPDPAVEQAVVADGIVAPDPDTSNQQTVASEQTSVAPEQMINNANVKVTFKGFGPGKEHIGGFSGITSALALTPAGAISGKVTIDMNTLSSDNERVTAHLKTPDFFDTAKYPTATFVVTNAPAITTGTGAGTLTGNLTLHGVTKSITIPYRYDGLAKAYTSTFTIDMKAFGIDQTFANEVVEVGITVPLE